MYLHDFKPYHKTFRSLLIEVKYKLLVVQIKGPLQLDSQVIWLFRISISSRKTSEFRIPTAQILHLISVGALKMAAFSSRLCLAREVNRHFLENENGDLSFFWLF